MNTLADMYWKGDEIQMDQKKAAELFMMAAEKGDPHAAINVGYMYENGIGLEQSAEQALKWYDLSGDMGLFEGLAAFAELQRKLAERRTRGLCDLEPGH
jgi:TPR repeat protein